MKYSDCKNVVECDLGNDDDYKTNKQVLYKVKGEDTFFIQNIHHNSCTGTIEVFEEPEPTFIFTWKQVQALATAKSEIRIPDIQTEDACLLVIYRWIETQTTMPIDSDNQILFRRSRDGTLETIIRQYDDV